MYIHVRKCKFHRNTQDVDDHSWIQKATSVGVLTFTESPSRKGITSCNELSLTHSAPPYSYTTPK